MRASITITGEANAKKMRTAFNRALLGVTKQATKATKPVLDRVTAAPATVAYPIDWTSEKQRRAYFATDGFGAGIPYQRTGLVVNSWELFAVERAGGQVEIILLNTSPQAVFVYGTFNNNDRYQQRFHRNSGWKRARTIRGVVMTEVNRQVKATFAETLKAFGRLV